MKKKLYLVIGIILLSIVTFIVLNVTGIINKDINEEKSDKSVQNTISEKEISIDLGDGVTIELVYINSGEFNMGSSEELGEEDETPVHKVTISKPFYMSKYEVTQKQWEKIMGYNNSVFKDENNPVDNVSYVECEEFLKKLSDLLDKEFSLPTEAQWEYACRAGSDTKWFFGSSEEKIADYAWIDINSEQKTNNVGTKKPNEWGLYDMYGNVQEWCSDWYENPYSVENLTDPTGPDNGDSRVLRGGAWGDNFEYVRSSYRNANGENEKTDAIGMRIVSIIN